MSSSPAIDLTATCGAVATALEARHGAAHRERIAMGLRQVVALWQSRDGSASDFEHFALAHFVVGDALDALFARLEFVLESLHGHIHEISRDLRWHADLDLESMLPLDTILSGYDPGAHFVDDAFDNKLAFVVLLNFRSTPLAERLESGALWTRRQWAQARLVDLFSRRIPAHVTLAVAEAAGASDRYIASYNLWAHHWVNEQGQRLFEAGKKLLSHWNLRDELKSRYAQGAGGLPHQRMIAQVMERIVTQTIPAAVIDCPLVDWNPATNSVSPCGVHDAPGTPPTDLRVDPAAEPDTRYQRLLQCFQAVRQMDPYCLVAPTHIARSFDDERQLPMERAVRMLEDVCASPLVGRVAQVIQQRLGRPLEPFDMWYSGFRAGSGVSEGTLDQIVQSRFPDAQAFKSSLAPMLTKLGFGAERAAWLASRIEVDPARGSGHAMGAQRKGDNARLRTRIGTQGMDYKGFNIAVHELGHNVEQTFSLNCVDHWLLNGVPNTAFTEAMAFVFQALDLKLLDQAVERPDAHAERSLNAFWSTYEIAGVSLVDIGIWQWMYAHPDATAAQLKEAVLQIAKDVWNRYYAPHFGQRDCVLLAIYSHLVHSFLYVPDYAIGHMIACQIEQHIQKTGNLGKEIERMATLGRLSPDLWMQQATGQPVGPQALLDAAAQALEELKR